MQTPVDKVVVQLDLGTAARQLGDLPAARRYLEDAIARFEAADAPDADDVLRELATLEAC